MARASEGLMISVLRRVQEAENEQLLYKFEFYEDLFPGDIVEPDYGDWDVQERAAIKAAIDLGYLKETKRREIATFPGEQVPDCANFFISLSGLGFQYLNKEDQSVWVRAKSQLKQNALTILVSVVTAVAIAAVVQKLGLG